MATFEHIVNVLTDSKIPQDFKDALIKEEEVTEEGTVEYLSRVFTIEEIEESESALNFAELTEEHKDKMRDFFDKVKQQIQKNDESKN